MAHVTPQPVASRLQPGTVLDGRRGRYTVVERRGEGGFGTTWRARRDADGLDVIVKELRIDRLGDWKALELFEREGRVLEGLQHPRIPRYVDLFAWDGRRAHAPSALGEGTAAALVLVQTFVAGRSLAERVAAGERLPPAAAERVLRDILDVLAYLHGLAPPIVHRDVSPGNVVVDPDGGAHLVDFGAIQDRLRMDALGGSTSVGTVGYVAVEQLMGKARPASDLYGLGATLLTVLTGSHPSELPSDDLTGKVRVDEALAHVDARLRRAIDAMVEPHLQDRARSAADVLAILDGAAPATDSKPPRVTRPARYGWLWRLAMASGALAAGAIYTVFFDDLSQTTLVQITPAWVAPIAFGLSGHLLEARGAAYPLIGAALWTAAAGVGLWVFFEGIFPAL